MSKRKVCTKSVPPKCYDMKGDGIVDSVKKVGNKVKEVAKNFASGMKDIVFGKSLPKRFREMWIKYKDNKVTSIEIGRDPVTKIIQSILNLVTSGEYKKAKQYLKYDDVYHIYMIVTLDNGTKLRIEKNQLPVMSIYSGTPKDSIRVPLNGKKITFNELLWRPYDRYGLVEFNNYHPTDRNCQIFIDNILTANGLNSAETKKFVLQDIKALLPETARSIGGAVTDIAGAISMLFGGKKRKKIVHTSKPPIPVQSGGALMAKPDNKPKFTNMPVVKPQIGIGVCRF